MRIVVIDFESFFADDYTLSKMSTEAYVRDKRFEAHGAAIKWSKNTPARWYDERQLREVLKSEDWSDVFLLSHHANFDHLILSHHYSVAPRMSGCTLSMARLLLGNHISVSLDSVRQQFGLPVKRTPYHLFKGKHWRELSDEIRQQVADGACDEVESIWTLFGILSKQFPSEEYSVVDTTIKMFTQPVLRADTELLAQIWEKEESDKSRRLADLGVSAIELQSSDRFADLIRAEGIEPETKEGPERKDGSRGIIYAFAKTDYFMEELLEHENPRVRALAEARIGQKSTLMQTRAETLGWMASRGPLCVYLRYAGAHTTRWSGGDKTNFQNFKKPDPDLPPDENPNIRDAVLAPEGWVLIKPDCSQIECRLLNFVAGQHDVIERFRNGEDPYVNVASAFYGYPVNRLDHPTERQCGKVLELQAGYGSGGDRIRHTLRVKTKGKILLTPEEGLKARDAYRDTHPAVTDLWKQAGRMLAQLAGGPPTTWGPCEVRNHRIVLPNKTELIYDTLEFHHPESEEEIKTDWDRDGWWRMKTRAGKNWKWTKMYGAKLVENLIQALARVVVSQAMIRVVNMGYRVVSMEHDSLWILIPEQNAEEHAERCRLELCRDVSWLPGLPLDAEVTLGERYSK